MKLSRKKRLAAWLLIAAMLAQSAPLTVLAQDIVIDADNVIGDTVEENIVTKDAATVVSSGWDGQDIGWTLYSDGLLRVEGMGEVRQGLLTDAEKESVTELIIGDGITAVGDFAFSDFKNLQKITFPSDGLQQIGNNAFNGCSSLTGELVLPDSLTSIGLRAFQKCTGLTGDLVIPKNVTSIDNYAFDTCRFTSLTFESPVPPTFGTGVFDGNPGLKQVSVPADARDDYVKVLGGIFDEDIIIGVEPEAAVLANGICNNDITWTLYDNGLLELSGEGAMWDYSDGGAGQSGVLADSPYCMQATRLVIGEGITSVGYCAFAYHNGITEIEFPESLESLSDGAFCREGEDLFAGIQVTFKGKTPPTGLEEAFAGIYFDEDGIPQTVYCSLDPVYVPAGSRDAYVTALKNIVGEKGIIGVESEPETSVIDSGKCGDNVTWTLHNDGLLELTGEGAMWDYTYSPDTNTGLLTAEQRGLVTALKINEGITSLGSYAFYNCSGFTGTLTIPDSVTSIGYHTFYGCRGFTGPLTIPDSVTSIGSSAFYNCGGFDGPLTISNSLTSIEHSVFAFCSGLTGQLTLPESLSAVSHYAFSHCTGFTGTLTIPAGVTAVRDNGFNGCSGITELVFEGSTPPTFGKNALGSMSSLTSIQVPSEDYDAYVTALDGVVDTSLIAEPVQKITGLEVERFLYRDLYLEWENTGYENSGMWVTVEMLNSDDTWTVLVGDEYTSSYMDVYLPSSGYTDLTVRVSILQTEGGDILAMSDPFPVVTDGFLYTVSGGNATITGYAGDSSSVAIPETIAGYPVTAIDLMNTSAHDITELFIPAGVTSIKNGSLDFSNLKKISVAKENTVYSSDDDGVLYDKAKTTIVIFPKCSYRNTEYIVPDTVTTIPAQCFRLADVGSVVIHAGVTSIGDMAFIQARNLTKIIVAEDNAKYSSDESGVLFNKDKTELICYPANIAAAEYTVPDGVTTIGDDAFFACDNLQKIDLPEGLVTIGESAWSSCSSITDIQIPASVKTIGDYAFYGCQELTHMVIESEDVEIEDYVFNFCPNVTIYAPAGSTAEAYAAANGIAFTVLEEPVTDTVPPVIEGVFPAHGETIGVNTEISVRVSDDLGADTLNVSYSTDGITWSELDAVSVEAVSAFVTVPLDVTSLGGADSVTLRITCTDLSGNTSEVTEITYSVDSVLPEAVRLSAEESFDGIVLTWEQISADDLAGFRIYRKAEGDADFRQIKAFAPDGKVSEYTYTDRTVSEETTYIYYVASEDNCGNTADSSEVKITRSSSEDIIEKFDREVPSANMILYRYGYVGEELPFDAQDSRDNGRIASYLWTFGDGTTAEGVRVEKAYTESGVYTVALTVKDAAGNSDTQTASITIKPKATDDGSGDGSGDSGEDTGDGDTEYLSTGDLIVKVLDSSGQNVSGAKVCFNLRSDDMQPFYTGSDGTVKIRDVGGTYQIGVYKGGYMPNTAEAEIVNGEETTVEIRMGKSEIVAGSLEAERMTLDEIKDAGIDVNDPDNQFVYKFVIELEYSLTPPSEGGSAEGDGTLGVPGGGGGGGSSERLTFPAYATDKGDPVKGQDKPTFLTPLGSNETIIVFPPSFVPTEDEKPPVPVVSVIKIPGEATWLKDFFEVSLEIINLAPSDSGIILENCIADLTVPLGLTLMDTDYTSADPTYRMADIEAGTSEKAEWILRGDKAGHYSLHADFTGELKDFDETITAQFRTDEAIRVRAGDNLYMDIIVEDVIEAESDSAIKVGLRNEDPEPYYMPNIKLENVTANGNPYKTSGGERITTNTDILYPGEEIWFEYIIEREDFSAVLENPESSYYLVNQVVKHVDGVPLQTTFQTVPPYTISGDIIEVYQIDPDSGVEYSANYIDIEKDSLVTARMPALVIKTYRLIDDKYQPCSMDFTVTDPLREEEKAGDKTFTGKTDEDGTFTVPGYEIVQLVKEKNYTIKVTGDRAPAVEIPVTVTGDLGTGSASVMVYTLEGTTRTLIRDASVTLGGRTVRTNSEGVAEFEKVNNGRQAIKVTANGYFECEDTVKIKDETELEIRMYEATSGASITYIKTSLSDYGSIVRIPYGLVTGQLSFEVKRHVPEGETFKRYLYKIEHRNGTVEEGDFTSTGKFSLDVEKLSVGSKLYFAVETDKGTSKYTDAGVEVVINLNILSNIKQNISLLTSCDTLKIKITDDLRGAVLGLLDGIIGGEASLVEKYNTVNETGAASDLLSKFLSSVRKTTVGYEKKPVTPLELEFNFAKSEYSVALGIMGSETSYSSTFEYIIDGTRMSFENPEGKSKAGLFGRLIFKYHTDDDCWTWRVELEQSAGLEKTLFAKPLAVFGTTGFSIWFDTGFSVNEELKISSRENEMGADENGTSFKNELPASSNVEISADGSVKFSVYEQWLSDDIQKAGIYMKTGIGAKYNHTGGGFDWGLLFELGWEAKLLIFEKSGKWVEKKVEDDHPELVSTYAARLRAVMEDTTSETYSVVKAPASVQWNSVPSAENVLQSEVFSGADPQIVTLADGTKLMVFADTDADFDPNNPVKLKYSVNTNGTWSEPEVVCTDDDTVDLQPSLTAVGNRAVLVWQDMGQELDNMGTMSVEEIRELYADMEIRTAEFDGSGWSDPVTVDNLYGLVYAPVTASDGETTMIAWIANEDNLEQADADSPDTIWYALIDENGNITTDKLVGTYSSAANLDLSVVNGTYVMSCTALNAEGTNIAYKCSYNAEEGKWNAAEQISTLETDTLALTADENGVIYYIMEGRLYRADEERNVVLAVSDTLNGAQELSVLNHNGRTFFSWVRGESAEMGLYLCYMDNNGEVSVPVKLETGETERYDTPVLAPNGANSIQAVYLTAAADANYPDDYVLNYTLNCADIDLEQDISVNADDVRHSQPLYPGAEVTTSFTAENFGLLSVDEVTAGIYDADGELIEESDCSGLTNYIIWKVPETYDGEVYTLKVLPKNGEDADESNNIVSIGYSFSDLEAVDVAYIGEEGENTSMILTLRNNGKVTSRRVTAVITDRMTDMELAVLSLGDISGGTETDHKISVNCGEYTDLAVEVTTESFDLDGGNNVCYLIIDEKITIETLPPKEAVELESTECSTTLEGEIGVNFYMDIPEKAAGDTNAYIQFTQSKADGTEVVTYVPIEDGRIDSGYRFTYEVAAKEMADVITAKFVSDNYESPDYPYSVKQYVKTLLETSGNDSAKALAKAMLYYGGYAQTMFGYNTDNLAYSDVLDPKDSGVDGVTAENFAEFKHTLTQKLNGVTYVGSRLVLEAETKFQPYFQISGDVIETITFTYNGQVLTPVRDGNYYRISIDNIAAKDLNEGHVITVSNGTDTAKMTFVPLTYAKDVYDVQDKPSLYKELVNVVNALYLYNCAADEYFDK